VGGRHRPGDTPYLGEVTLDVPGATGFVALAQRAFIGTSGAVSCPRSHLRGQDLVRVSVQGGAWTVVAHGGAEVSVAGCDRRGRRHRADIHGGSPKVRGDAEASENATT